MRGDPQRRGASARVRKQSVLDAQAKYDAAGNGRRIASWNPGTRGPNAVNANAQKLRDRAQDAIRNDWAAARSQQNWATSLIGVGITPRWKNKRITELWNEFVPFADADGVNDAYGLQTLGVMEWMGPGEVFLRRRPRPITTDLPVPLQAQMIPSEFCPDWDATAWPGMPRSHEIRRGVEFNVYGRRIAYWMHRAHPHEYNPRPTPDQLVRVPASDITHLFEPKRAGQIRGVSEFASVLTRIRAANNFEDAVLDRQLLANLFVMFIKRALPENADIDYDEETGLPKWYTKDGQPMAGLESGIAQQLLPGEDVVFSNPPEAGTTYSDYMRSTHLGTAAGTGQPYEMLTGDIRDVSDRTYRVVINEFRRFARQRQWQRVIPFLCQPMVKWWADALLLSGQIGQSEYDEARKPAWSPEGWAYIHPTQDAEGKKIELEMGTTSRQRLIAERGDDVEDIDNERADDKKREDKLGLTPVEPQPGAAQAGKPAPGKPQPTASAPDEFQMRLLDAATRQPAPAPDAMALIAPLLAQMQASNAAALDALRAQQAASEERFAALAAAAIGRPLTVTNEVPVPAVNVTNNVEPTPVQVDVAPAAINVTNNVEPTPVHVEAKAGDVRVTADVNLPDREITSVISRDFSTDQITKVVQTETTVKPPTH